MEENSEKTRIKQDTRFKPGQSGNPAGRPKGSKNFETDFDEAVEEIAKESGITRSEARKLLLKVAFKNAKEGNYSFYKDIHDRIYGQATAKNEHTGKDGKDLIITGMQIIEDIQNENSIQNEKPKTD